MRNYTIYFLEQRIGRKHPTPVAGDAGAASFLAADDDLAVKYVAEHFLERMATCVRAELSSMALVDHGTSDAKLMDDSHAKPHFQDTSIRLNPHTRQLEVDFESTTTALLADMAVLRKT